MAKVKAAYNYSYNYEGQKISFKKDEEFQLLTKSNKDWWQVRRWLDGSAQDIYVPAVYVKEVDAVVAPVVKKEHDPTYMNLDDLKIPKSYESQNGKTADKSPEAAPVVLSKPKSNSSFKKNSLDRNKAVSAHAQVERKTSSEKASLEGSTQSNGLNPARPVSPSMLQKLSKPVSPVAPASNLVVSEGGGGGGGGGGPGQVLSLKRNEIIAPPVSTKPRSKSNIDAAGTFTESSLDSGSRNIQRQISGGVSSTKGKVPPPVKSKLRLQKQPVARPVSCITPGTDTENAGSKPGFMENAESSKPIVSQLSSVLLKKNPHLAASEHKALVKSSSVEQPFASRAAAGLFSGDGLSKSVDMKTLQSPTEAQRSWVS